MDIANVITSSSFGGRCQTYAINNNRFCGAFIKPFARAIDALFETGLTLKSLGQIFFTTEGRFKKLEEAGTHLALAAYFTMDIAASIFVNLINPKIYSAVADSIEAKCATEDARKNTQIQTLATELLDAQNNLALTQESLNASEAALGSDRKAREQLIEQFKAHKEETHATVIGMQKGKYDLEVQLKEREAELTESTKKNNDLRGMVNASNARVKNLADENTQLKSTHQTEKASLEKRIKDLEEDLGLPLADLSEDTTPQAAASSSDLIQKLGSSALSSLGSRRHRFDNTPDGTPVKISHNRTNSQ